MSGDPAEPQPDHDEGEACDHQWEKVDASFSHEFGTEIIHYTECSKCGERKEPDDDDTGCDDGPDEPDYDAERPPTALENWQRNDEHNVR